MSFITKVRNLFKNHRDTVTPVFRPGSRLTSAGISIILFLILAGCTKTFNTEKELWGYLQDESNGYVQHKNINGIDFTLIYKPTDLLVKQELGENGAIDQINALRKKYSQYLYFNLSMSRNNQELLSSAADRNQFGAMVNQLAFGMGNKVHVYTQQKDTLELLDFVYPRMYGMSHSTDILFVYPKDEKYLKDEYLNFTVEDLGLYSGDVKFKIPVKNIKEEPTLNLKG